MQITGIDISEKLTQIAITRGSKICLINLRYNKSLDLSDLASIAGRLTDLQKAVRKTTKTAIKDTVVSIPSYLTIKDRHIIKRCGDIVGLNIIRFLTNITSASLYSSYKDCKDDRMILCFKRYGKKTSLGLYRMQSGLCDALSTFSDPQQLKRLMKNKRIKTSCIYKVLSIGSAKNRNYYNNCVLPILDKGTRSNRIKFSSSLSYPALGALLQSSILCGIEKDMLILDVTPFSYGISSGGKEDILYCPYCWMSNIGSIPDFL